MFNFSNIVKIIISAAILGIGIIIGYILRPPLPQVDTADIERSAIGKLEQEFNSKKEQGLIKFIAEVKNQTSLSGKITSIDKQTNTVKVEAPNKYAGGNFFTYLNQPDYYIKIIKINADTEILKREEKDIAQYMKEMGEYGKNGNKGPVPMFYKETKISAENLGKDMDIFVGSESEIKLEGDEIIQAKKIIINTPAVIPSSDDNR